MSYPAPGPVMRTEYRGRAAIVTLTRHNALNALSIEMIRSLADALESATRDRRIEVVIVRGEGRAFCSGGDVRAIWMALGNEGPTSSVARDFFAEEYRLNLAIARSPKPYVALVDGIAMGGGLGISVHGSHRVVTEKASLAMPETAIGMVPDVGGTFFLSRVPRPYGQWLALTGARVGAGEAIALGLATHFVRSEHADALVDALAKDGLVALPTHTEAPPAAQLPTAADVAPFAAANLDAIISALDAAGTPFAADAAATLRARSKTSLEVTHRLLDESFGRDLESCLRAEYRAVRAMTRSHDFEAGIRAVLVEKRGAAQFQFEPEVVARAFAAPEEGDWTAAPLARS